MTINMCEVKMVRFIEVPAVYVGCIGDIEIWRLQTPRGAIKYLGVLRVMM